MEQLRSKNGFICDMGGVIYHGNRLLPGVKEFVDWLYREDKNFLFLTNSSGLSPKEHQQKLARMGLDVDQSHFYTSALATASFILGQSPNGTAYEIGGAAIINGGPNTENAKIFMDWLLTKEAQELSVETSYRYPVRSDVAAPEGLPALDEVDLVDYDRDKATEMKESVLEKFEAEIMANRA